MREILFRFWDYRLQSYTYFDLSSSLPLYTDEKEGVVEQFTGLFDSKGNKIFEGDIISEKWMAHSEDEFGVEYEYQVEVVRRVAWDLKHGAWNLSDKNNKLNPFTIFHITVAKSEIVGNINQNPELLK